MFRQGNTYGKGRVKGSKNKLVNREGAIELLDKIIEDLNLNYSTLTIDDKLRLLSTFKQLYNFEFINEMEELTEIKVHITFIFIFFLHLLYQLLKPNNEIFQLHLY